MRRPRVLVAEDDESVRSLLKAIAARGGCDVETAAHGLEALAILRDREVDILLLDLMMPVLSGYDVIPQLRQLRYRPAVIVVTAMTTQRYLEVDPNVVTAVIRKPFDIEVLGEIIAEVANHMAAGGGIEWPLGADDASTHVC